MQNNPANIATLSALAGLKMHVDDFKKSAKYLNKSLFLEPERITTLLVLGGFANQRNIITDVIQ